MIIFNNSYNKLNPIFFSRVKPTPVSNPQLIKFNFSLAEELGFNLDGIDQTSLAKIFCGNNITDGADPLAMVYAGHQFAHFVPQLGDGRAILLGEVIDSQSQRRDIQLKGAGITPYSRRGDGRAALGPVLREYIISEAMHALGIPTTRALAAVRTGDSVVRESILPGAVFTRVASSHIRIGTFEYFANLGNLSALKDLADYSIARHYSYLKSSENPYIDFLAAVCERQSNLIAQWMLVGFIHGVMNTDNMTISGETIDYGPCAFMDQYNPDTVFSYIDHNGRYSYKNQPLIAQWNLCRLAESLLPLIHQYEKRALELAHEVLSQFILKFEAAWLSGMRAKLGLTTKEDADLKLIESFLELLAEEKSDFTNSFRMLASQIEKNDSVISQRQELWLQSWRARLQKQDESSQVSKDLIESNCPVYIPRNHKVEQALRAAEVGDYAALEELLVVLNRPFEERIKFKAYSEVPKPEEVIRRTFCGT